MTVPDAVMASAVTGLLLLLAPWLQQRYSLRSVATQLGHERSMRDRERLVQVIFDFNSAA